MSNILQNPRGGCVLAGINAVLSAIDGVIPVYHSGPGCNMQNFASEHGQSGGKMPELFKLPSSNMFEKEVVFGGVDKLRTTVQGAIDVLEADTFFILTGCTSGIIGDDIESIAQEYRDKGHQVFAIDTPGFAGDSNLGYEVIWNNFIDQFITPLSKDEKLVNIFGILPYHDPFWSGNLEEIDRILTRLGLKVNTFFINDQSIENVKQSSSAALNIIIHPWIFKGPAEKYKEKFDIPYIRYPGLPIGATDTTKFVHQVAEALNLDKEHVESVIASEEHYVYKYLGQAIGALAWKRFAVVGDASTAIGITHYLANDFSFTPKLVIISEEIYRDEDKERIINELTNLEYARPPKVIFEADQYRINKTLDEFDDLTLIVGSANEKEVGSLKGIQTSNLLFPIKGRLIYNRAIAGYRGSLTLTEDLYDNL